MQRAWHARGEQTGVDGTRDGRVGRHLGDHRHTECVLDIACGEGAPGFGDQHHPGWPHRQCNRTPQREVAGSDDEQRLRGRTLQRRVGRAVAEVDDDTTECCECCRDLGAIGGELFDTPQALLQALDKVPSRSATYTFPTPHALWDGWPTIVFLLVVLSLEWLLRKRFNLL